MVVKRSSLNTSLKSFFTVDVNGGANSTFVVEGFDTIATMVQSTLNLVFVPSDLVLWIVVWSKSLNGVNLIFYN